MAQLSLHWVPQDGSAAVCQLLPENGSVRMGRAPADGWIVVGDMSISREHVDLWAHGGQLAIRCLETARNPILVNGQALREALIPGGGTFRIGATAFQVKLIEVPGEGEASIGQTDDDSQDVFFEQGYSNGELKKFGFGSAEQQIEILSNLPNFIANARTDDDLGLMIAQQLLQGIPQSDAVAAVQYNEEDLAWDSASGTEPPEPVIVKVETRDGLSVRFRPSRRLILKSLRLQQSVMHIWGGEGGNAQFTMTEGLGWAFCSPMRGEGCNGWCLYVSGKGSRAGSLMVSEEQLRGDLRFTELLAQFTGSIRHVRHLQDQRTQLSAFFSPKVIENLTAGKSPASLEPAERDVTVLFCDLRGFSKRSETLQHDLLMLLKSVSEALGVMAEGVLGMDGAIADFQGDAVLGFWGWPLPHPEGPLPACRAALRIDSEFRRLNEAGHELLKGLSCGVGIAYGPALAGKIGTDRQSKIGVFGPIVDFGSRLESLTKQFGVSICLDEAAAEFARTRLSPAEGRLRKVARVRGKGLDSPTTIYTLLPPEKDLPQVTQGLIESCDTAIDAIISGRWVEANEILRELPAEDGIAKFLRAVMKRAGNGPPSNWDGAFRLDT